MTMRSRFRKSMDWRKWVLALGGSLLMLGAGVGAAEGVAELVEVENVVQRAAGSAGLWGGAAVGDGLAVGDRVRTRQRSRATLRFGGLYTARLEQLTTVEVTPALVAGEGPKLDLRGGAAFLFSRERAGEMGVRTPTANAALRGTQLLVRVSGGATFWQVLEGEVEVANAAGRLVLGAGEAAEVFAGKAPRKTAVVRAENLLSWALYYPAVLGPADLREVRRDPVVEEYLSGNLPAAIGGLGGRLPAGSEGLRLRSALLLAVGRVDEVRAVLRRLPVRDGGRRAMEILMDAVQNCGRDEEMPTEGVTASELVAWSYHHQSRSRLKEARAAAERAVELDPGHGFAWVRLAELEFSFGRNDRAEAALARGLDLSPQHGQGHALRGFLLSGRHALAEAEASFGEAIRLDGALGNGWLGRGLVRTRRGDREGGIRDLQTAATVEPVSSFFHSYLGKALSGVGRRDDAVKDFAMAKELDPRDPTPWFYGAVDLAAVGRFNEAVRELGESVKRNDNRRVYRSGFLLDQDRAVRSTNLARIYQNAGMGPVAVREAVRAVESDYTNGSAHGFLANAYDALRDPRRIELRQETPWFSELLMSNLLSPPGGGPLSQFVSQQEYGRLLESDGLGASVMHEWRQARAVGSRSLRTTASVFGNRRGISFGVDAHGFDDDGGVREGSRSDRRELYGQVKFEPTGKDLFYFLGKWQEEAAGDNFATWDRRPISPGLAFRERQEPGLLLGGWNRRWAPGVHTLVLGGWLSAAQDLRDPGSRQLLVRRDVAGMSPGFVRQTPEGFQEYADPALRRAEAAGWERQAMGLPPDGSEPAAVDWEGGQAVKYSRSFEQGIRPYLGTGGVLGVSDEAFGFMTQRRFDLGTAEVQQIVAGEGNTVLAGGRWQEGEIESGADLAVVRPTYAGGFPEPALAQREVSRMSRQTVYLYDYFRPAGWLTLVGGVVWDRLSRPENFRNPPLSGGSVGTEDVLAKAGFTVAPAREFVLRGAWSEGVGGMSFDESVRLEPVQISGFSQAFRTVISESLVGSVEGPRYETWGLSAEGQLGEGTWWNVGAGEIRQEVERTLGVFDGYDLAVLPLSPAYFPGKVGQSLGYVERTLSATLHQMVGDRLTLGLGWRRTDSRLRNEYGEIPVEVAPWSRWEDRAVLAEWNLAATWNSPRGWFARFEANWMEQELDDDPVRQVVGEAVREGDRFWQTNVLMGWRFRRNLCEVSAGVLNLGDRDYRLSPLNPRAEIERGRTFLLRCRLSF